jgi:hypothetical protein
MTAFKNRLYNTHLNSYRPEQVLLIGNFVSRRDVWRKIFYYIYGNTSLWSWMSHNIPLWCPSNVETSFLSTKNVTRERDTTITIEIQFFDGDKTNEEERAYLFQIIILSIGQPHILYQNLLLFIESYSSSKFQLFVNNGHGDVCIKPF